MIDIDETTCRICLENGAIYPIFESNEEFESVYAKLAICIREKVEDIEGYPHNICLKCKNTSDIISNFVAKFEKSCEILKSKIVHIKKEYLEDYNIDISDNELEPFTYELQTDEPVKPKDEKRDPTELFESLSHLTVKRIKVENIFETFCNENENNIQKKRGRPKKDRQTDCKTKKAKGDSLAKRKGVTKKAKSKKVGETGAATKSKGKAKKAVAKPVVGKNNGASKQSNKDTSKQEIEKHRLDENQEKDDKATKKVLLCDHCGKTYSVKDYLKNHILVTHTERKYKCSECPKDFSRECDYNNHKKRHDNVRSHVCNTCGKGFFARKLLVGHIRYVHEKKKVQQTKQYKCKYCDKTYSYRRGIVIHERSVHTGERPEVCQICGGSFYDVVYLREHMRIHTGDTPFQCPVCARGYTQLGNMKSHMRNHRISDISPEALAKIKPSYFKFMRPTPKKEGIETNQTKATRIPRLCDLCGITCAHSDILARHKISVHGEKNHKCNKCTKTYFTKHQLNVHYMSRHENVITAVCDYCGKGFFAKHRLRVHVVTVHFKKKKNPHVYKCEFCEKTFKYKKGAINHERAVHTGERPAACDVCGSSFFDVSYLKQHKRLHTGETPYKCPVCARGYAQCGNMKSHMRNHRISELDPEILAKVKPSYYKFMRP